MLAAIPSIDLDSVELHLHRGNPGALQAQLSDAQTFIERDGLEHRFKSMVHKSAASSEDAETLLEFLKEE